MSSGDDQNLDGLLKQAAKLGVETPAREGCLDDEVLLAYRRGKLSAEKEEAVDLHLAGCASCRRLLSALDEKVDDLSAKRAKDALLSRRKPWAGWAAAAAALFLAIAGSIAMLRRSEPATAFTVEGPFGGIEEVRGSATGSKRFDQNSTFRLIVRPEKSTEEHYSVALFLTRDGEAERETHVYETTRAQNGTVELVAPAKSLFERAGTYSVACVVRSGSGVERATFEAEYLERSP